jgi:Tfp pilus assembly protein FimV
MILFSVVRKPDFSVKTICRCLLLIGVINSLPVEARNVSATTKHRAAATTKSDGGFESANVSADGSYYGPVRSNDSLSAIASYFAQRRDCSRQQMQSLIFEHNPQAFINGNIYLYLM